MKLVSIKTAKESGIPGVEFVFTDKAITEVIIGKLRIRKGESYSSGLQVLIEAPFETVERFKLVGSIEGFPDAVSYHETKYDAENAGNRLEDAGAKISIERVDVMIDDAGEVVTQSLAPPRIPEVLDTPF